MTEFNLSEKREELFEELLEQGVIFNCINDQDKEFIRLLKEDFFEWCGGIGKNIEDCDTCNRIINKRAGSELI